MGSFNMHFLCLLSDFLVMHLQELVRMVFIAATAICDQLKLEGLSTLQVVDSSTPHSV